MNQELSDWASIAEIVSSIAVVVTLVFLVTELQENTEVTRAIAYDRNIDSLSEVRNRIVSDPDVARIWQAFQDNESGSLEGPDRTRLRQLVFWLFGVYEQSYFANRYGVLGSSEWSRFSVNVCFQYGLVLSSTTLVNGLRFVVTEEFMEYMEATCGE